MITSERTIPTNKAIELGLDLLKEMNLDFAIECTGSHIFTHTCRIFDLSGNEVTRGNGKGLSEQSKASAIFEALEHYITESHPVNVTKTLVISEILNQVSRLSEEKVLQLISSLFPNLGIPVTQYISVNFEEQIIYYPSFLTSPNYLLLKPPTDLIDYTFLTKYSTNNGTAIGVNKTEALVHSICEIIERDSISCLLLKIFISKNNSEILIIKNQSLPLFLIDIMSKIKLETGFEPTIFNITSDISIPSYVATIPNREGLPFFVGSGTSLNEEYAIERALTEVLQSFHLYDDELEQEDILLMKKFDQLDKYKQCIIFDILSTTKNKIYVEFVQNNNSTENLPRHIDSYLQTLIDILANSGYHVFHRNLYQSESGICCVHCVIPGLERFHLVRYGKEVLPSQRGRNLL